MAHFAKLVAVLALACSGFAHAGYAQVSPPSNFGGTAAAGWTYKPSANDVSFTNGVRGSAGVLNVGGRAVTMPAAYRFAANSGRLAARFSFGNPALFAVMTVGGLVYQYYADQGFQIQDGVWKKVDPGLCTFGPCYEYRNTNDASSPYVRSKDVARDAHIAYHNANPRSEERRVGKECRL